MSFPREDFWKDHVPFVRPTDAVSQRRSIRPTRRTRLADVHPIGRTDALDDFAEMSQDTHT
jgi:hypothetical protein